MAENRIERNQTKFIEGVDDSFLSNTIVNETKDENSNYVGNNKTYIGGMKNSKVYSDCILNLNVSNKDIEKILEQKDPKIINELYESLTNLYNEIESVYNNQTVTSNILNNLNKIIDNLENRMDILNKQLELMQEEKKVKGQKATELTPNVINLKNQANELLNVKEENKGKDVPVDDYNKENKIKYEIVKISDDIVNESKEQKVEFTTEYMKDETYYNIYQKYYEMREEAKRQGFANGYIQEELYNNINEYEEKLVQRQREIDGISIEIEEQANEQENKFVFDDSQFVKRIETKPIKEDVYNEESYNIEEAQKIKEIKVEISPDLEIEQSQEDEENKEDSYEKLSRVEKAKHQAENIVNNEKTPDEESIENDDEKTYKLSTIGKFKNFLNNKLHTNLKVKYVEDENGSYIKNENGNFDNIDEYEEDENSANEILENDKNFFESIKAFITEEDENTQENVNENSKEASKNQEMER